METSDSENSEFEEVEKYFEQVPYDPNEDFNKLVDVLSELDINTDMYSNGEEECLNEQNTTPNCDQNQPKDEIYFLQANHNKRMNLLNNKRSPREHCDSKASDTDNSQTENQASPQKRMKHREKSRIRCRRSLPVNINRVMHHTGIGIQSNRTVRDLFFEVRLL